MQSSFAYIFLFPVLVYCSCKQTSTYGIPVEDPVDILKDQTSFLKYYNTLKLSADFIALDASSKIITRGEFLKQVSSGAYLPLRLTSKDSVYYKLYKINTPTDYMIWIKDMGDREYKHYQMEGKTLPKFNFIDLDGRIYNQETTKGKIVVLKFWFIGCVPCVQEMPALNKLVNQYKNRKDIVFVSLAFDKKEDLKKFLVKTTFNYAVVANQKDYLIKDLGITSFPTHTVINKKGIVVKVLDSYKEMESVLKKESLK